MVNEPLSPDPPDPPLIVVAEDDEAMRSLVASCLRIDGYDVLEAADGEELMFIVHAASAFPNPNTVRPALVLSDIRMPHKTGIEALAMLRSEELLAPFVLLSAFADEATREAARALGALAVLSKPFDLRALRWLVANLVPLAA